MGGKDGAREGGEGGIDCYPGDEGGSKEVVVRKELKQWGRKIGYYDIFKLKNRVDENGVQLLVVYVVRSVRNRTENVRNRTLLCIF